MSQDLIQKAEDFACKKHISQIDENPDERLFQGKNSYFLNHCCKVANIIRELPISKDDDNLICAAYLHDTLEDTNTTYEELVKEFNKDIADLVLEVTHEGKKDSKGYYFPRLKSKRAIMLKLADRLSNLDRIGCWDEKRQLQYLKNTKFWRSE